jgi:hypothetical protein
MKPGTLSTLLIIASLSIASTSMAAAIRDRNIKVGIGLSADQTWLGKHPRFVMRFTPTGVSWLNMVERFFRDISENRIKRDSFTSVAELEMAIDLYIAAHNAEPKPFIWTAGANDILAKVTRAKKALAAVST